ncbi:hypothetical protein [Hydrogenophaga sp. ZJX-1]|uniref:hypothetical protein n=1 Tax=Hydrogenophaga sp. ZJX-1 TaxID=3404778 RepID=UPI003B282850
MPHSSRAAGLAALLAVSACSPTFNWRELRLDGTPLQALLPCKPESATRAVPLAVTPTELHMHSCEAGGLRFAVAWADVGDVVQVPVALAAWRSASLQAIRVVPPPVDDPSTQWGVTVAGAPAAQGVSAQGQDPQGQPVQTRAAYFAQGTQVYQAAVYGAKLSDEAVDGFFAGLRLSGP